MKVLVIGGGAREHAITWKIHQSPKVSEILIAPGNGGTAGLGENISIAADDIESLIKLAVDRHVDLVIVGPEDALAAGIVDRLQALQIPVFGPTQLSAEIESSKAFAKQLMESRSIATAESKTFSDFELAVNYSEAQETPIVIKADGLAAGKGVVIAQSHEEAKSALHDAMVSSIFGDAGKTVVIERFLDGLEASVFGFCDGKDLAMALPACDYKRVFDGDEGLNTGGMGGYSPPEFVNQALMEDARTQIMQPMLDALRESGRPFTGVLYGGLIVTEGGLQVIEFNARLGDPETQLLLPRLNTDLIDVIEACIQGRIRDISLDWRTDSCVGVVLASPGYPGSYPRGLSIEGLDSLDDDILVFHAGTTLDEGSLVTNGGRVLTVVALGSNMEDARQRVYENVRRIKFDGMHYRNDIAARAI